jgi:hypothetical protein
VLGLIAPEHVFADPPHRQGCVQAERTVAAVEPVEEAHGCNWRCAIAFAFEDRPAGTAKRGRNGDATKRQKSAAGIAGRGSNGHGTGSISLAPAQNSHFSSRVFALKMIWFEFIARRDLDQVPEPIALS